MEYNTQKKKLLLPEYGRNIQKMVDYLLTIEDREERTRAAKTVIDVMGNLYPHLRDVPDFRHKLWDHLAIMSEFKLDIDTPYPLPSLSKLQEKPERLPYSSNHIKYKHYGKLVEKLIDKIKELEDPEQKRALIVLTANHMKKSFLTWNKDSVEDEQIYNDINTLCGCTVILPEGMTLSNPKDLLQKKTILGSNSGNKRQLITEAIRILSSTEQWVMASSFYETAPWGFECDENFLNQVVVFQTRLSAFDFLQRCLETEKRLGRIRLAGGPRYSSRPIDIDLLFYDSVILNTPDLILPHPRMQERNFVLTPLAEILPDFVHPVFQKTIATLLQECPDKLQARKLPD